MRSAKEMAEKIVQHKLAQNLAAGDIARQAIVNLSHVVDSYGDCSTILELTSDDRILHRNVLSILRRTGYRASVIERVNGFMLKISVPQKLINDVIEEQE